MIRVTTPGKRVRFIREVNYGAFRIMAGATGTINMPLDGHGDVGIKLDPPRLDPTWSEANSKKINGLDLWVSAKPRDLVAVLPSEERP